MVPNHVSFRGYIYMLVSRARPSFSEGLVHKTSIYTCLSQCLAWEPCIIILLYLNKFVFSPVNVADGTQFADMFLQYKFNPHNGRDVKACHGLALIFVNEDFTKNGEAVPDKKRYCVPADTELLEESLKKLGFRVVVRKNQTAEAMQDAFDKIRCNSDRDLLIKKEDKSFICVIGSHGGFDSAKETDFICGSDLKTFDLRATVYDKLGATNCKLLRETPKLFFVQACRGRQMEAIAESTQVAFQVAEGLAHQEQPYRLPQGSDFFISYSTAREKYAFRPASHSSDPCKYFKALCGALDAFAPRLDLMNMVLHVHKKLQGSKEYIINTEDPITKQRITTRQCPHVSTSLRGPVFFFDSAKERFARSLD